nr:Shedu immune nuclease family protein [Paenibacillus dendrobii]
MESTWHEFFIQHNWVLSQCFSLPFILFKDKAYAGGKDLSNRGGSLLDFIYKNNLFENVAIIEIKTPLTKLIGQEYRSGVFSMSADLSGSLNQLLHYKDRLQKEFFVNRYNSKTVFHALNPKCILLIGALDSLNDSEKQNFELFRSELRSIEIITYDELFEKVNLLKDLLL